jgi:protein TilB
LQYLNLAVNNITKVQNLQRCESLQKLDLTLNFVPKAGLLSIPSLAGNYNLRELFLIGNPCTDWHGYRQYIVGKLPQLAKLVRGAAASVHNTSSRNYNPQACAEPAAAGVS